MDFLTNVSHHKAEALLDFITGMLLTEVHAVVSNTAIDKAEAVAIQVVMALITGCFVYTGREIAKMIHNYFKRKDYK